MTENVNQNPDQAAPKKGSGVNKYLRNFFFKALASRKEFKGVESEIGKIEKVTVIISKEKKILRAQSANEKRDIDFTPEEMAAFLKTLNVKKETVENSRSIFVMLHFGTKRIFIQQNRLDGEKKEFEI